MEWRSKKQLDEYIFFTQNRNEVIGWVSDKTLFKWQIPIPSPTPEIKYIYQHGNNFSIYTFHQNIDFISKYYN